MKVIKYCQFCGKKLEAIIYDKVTHEIINSCICQNKKISVEDLTAFDLQLERLFEELEGLRAEVQKLLEPLRILRNDAQGLFGSLKGLRDDGQRMRDELFSLKCRMSLVDGKEALGAKYHA